MPTLRSFTALTIFVIASHGQLASAQEPVFSLAIFGGGLSGDTEGSSEFALAASYHYSESLRFELEYVQEIGGDLDGTTESAFGDITFEVKSLQALCLNTVYVYADSYSKYQPYMGIGIGTARRSFKASAEVFPDTIAIFSENDDVTRYTAFGGVDYNVSPTLAIGGLIRFAQMESIDTTSFGVSFRFKF